MLCASILNVKESSTVRSFRIDKSYSDIINMEAERMGISVNAMVNSVLKQYAEFSRFQSKLDMIIINREILKTLLNLIDEDNIYNIGISLGKNIPHDVILFWKKNVSSQSVFEYIEKILCTYGHIGTFDYIDEDQQKVIVIRHRLGLKGSKFLQGYIKALLNDTLKINPSIEVSDFSLKIVLPNENI